VHEVQNATRADLVKKYPLSQSKKEKTCLGGGQKEPEWLKRKQQTAPKTKKGESYIVVTP